MASLLGAGICASFVPFESVLALSSVPLPTRPMLLKRRVERDLRDGARLVVTREWQAVFTPQGRGISVTGEQTSVSVEAPALLAPLAEIEESRSTDGMFPIMLDQTGMIMATGDAIEQQDLNAAISKARSMIRATSSDTASQSRRLAFLSQLQQAGSDVLEQMPKDLFFPAGNPVKNLRPLELPGGMTGEFEFSYIAEAAPDAPWLAQAERQIVTRIGKDERRSKELWTLT